MCLRLPPCRSCPLGSRCCNTEPLRFCPPGYRYFNVMKQVDGVGGTPSSPACAWCLRLRRGMLLHSHGHSCMLAPLLFPQCSRNVCCPGAASPPKCGPWTSCCSWEIGCEAAAAGSWHAALWVLPGDSLVVSCMQPGSACVSSLPFHARSYEYGNEQYPTAPVDKVVRDGLVPEHDTFTLADYRARHRLHRRVCGAWTGIERGTGNAPSWLRTLQRVPTRPARTLLTLCNCGGHAGRTRSPKRCPAASPSSPPGQAASHACHVCMQLKLTYAALATPRPRASACCLHSAPAALPAACPTRHRPCLLPCLVHPMLRRTIMTWRTTPGSTAPWTRTVPMLWACPTSSARPTRCRRGARPPPLRLGAGGVHPPQAMAAHCRAATVS